MKSPFVRRICTCICTVVLSLSLLVAFIGFTPPPSGATVKPKWFEPIFALGPQARTFFTCVIFRESRSTWTHPHTHDTSNGQYGIFQITWPSQDNAWDAYVYPKLHVEPPYATAREQSEGAAILWKLGMGEMENTWGKWDGCV